MGKPRPIQLFTDLTTIQEETGGGKEEADPDKVAFPTIEHVADMEARRSTSRRSSDSDSLNSSYKILPPIKKPLEPETQSESEADFGREEDLREYTTMRMKGITERTLGVALTELRKIDR